MEKYNKLLENAINEISKTFKKRAIGTLIAGRAANCLRRHSGLKGLRTLNW